jgi:hypothetical protein
LKPFFIHTSLNPRAFKKVKDKKRLPVFWSANKKAWMTSSLFEKWFNEMFIPEVKAYCRRKNIPFKILLLLDNCTAHPNLSHINPNVKIYQPYSANGPRLYCHSKGHSYALFIWSLKEK